MLYACIQRFDVTRNLKKFYKILETKQTPSRRRFECGVDSVPKLPCSYTAIDHMSWRLFRCIADSNKELSQPNKQLSNQQGRTPAGIS